MSKLMDCIHSDIFCLLLSKAFEDGNQTCIYVVQKNYNEIGLYPISDSYMTL